MIIRNWIEKLKDLEQTLWPEYTYKLSQTMRQVLEEKPFTMADVGAAYGTDPRWLPVEKYAQFVTFEPDVRSQDYSTTNKTVNFSTGLSDHPSEKPLYLTKLPAASSLYPLNIDALKCFANYEWHEVVGSASITLDTLDHCLDGRAELQPDFLKVDVEGADLDVLKGGEAALDKSILGLQIEVSFIERHRGAPFFSDADIFLRERGFSLFILSREHWVRQNQTYGPNSRPQLVWGDAVYLLSRTQLLERLNGLHAEAKLVLLVKFIVILLGYGIHDYAIEVIDAVTEVGIISEDISQELKQSVFDSVTPTVAYCLRCLFGIGVTTSFYLLAFPIAPLRRRLGGYVHKHWAKLLQWGAKTSSRGGLYKSSISDVL